MGQQDHWAEQVEAAGMFVNWPAFHATIAER